MQKPSISEISNQAYKMVEWNTVKKEVDLMTDRIGTLIDNDIKELIIGLNIFKFNTVMSCVGHVGKTEETGRKKRFSAPYVSFESKLQGVYKNREKELIHTIKIAHTSKKKDAIKSAYTEYHTYMFNTKVSHNDPLPRLINLLTEFYDKRRVPYYSQLVINGVSSQFEIRNAGFINTFFTHQTLNQMKLKEYQNEFISFGEFLKIKFYSK